MKQQQHTRTYNTKKGFKTVVVNKGKKPEDNNKLLKIGVGLAALGGLGLLGYMNRKKIVKNLNNPVPKSPNVATAKVAKTTVSNAAENINYTPPANIAKEYHPPLRTKPKSKSTTKYVPESILDPWDVPTVTPRVVSVPKIANIPTTKSLPPSKYVPEQLDDPWNIPTEVTSDIKTKLDIPTTEVPKLKPAYDTIPDWWNMSDDLQTKYINEDIDYLKQRITNRNKRYDRLQTKQSKVKSELNNLQQSIGSNLANDTNVLKTKRQGVLQNEQRYQQQRVNNGITRKLAARRNQIRKDVDVKLKELSREIDAKNNVSSKLDANVTTNLKRMNSDMKDVDTIISVPLQHKSLVDDFLADDVVKYYDDDGLLLKDVDSKIKSSIKDIEDRVHKANSLLGRLDSKSIYRKLDNNLKYIQTKINKLEKELSTNIPNNPKYQELARLQDEYNQISNTLGFDNLELDAVGNILQSNTQLKQLYSTRLELNNQTKNFKGTLSRNVDKLKQSIVDNTKAKGKLQSSLKQNIKEQSKRVQRQYESQKLLKYADSNYQAKYKAVESKLDETVRLVNKELDNIKTRDYTLDVKPEYIYQRTEESIKAYHPDILKARTTFDDYLDKVNSSVSIEEIKRKARSYYVGADVDMDAKAITLYKQLLSKLDNNVELSPDELYLVKKFYDTYNRRQLKQSYENVIRTVNKFNRETNLNPLSTQLSNISTEVSKPYPIENNVRSLNKLVDGLVQGEFISDISGNVSTSKYHPLTTNLASKVNHVLYRSNVVPNNLIDIVEGSSTVVDNTALVNRILRVKEQRKLQSDKANELLEYVNKLKKQANTIDVGDKLDTVDNLVRDVQSRYNAVGGVRDKLRVIHKNPKLVNRKNKPRDTVLRSVKDDIESNPNAKVELDLYTNSRYSYISLNKQVKKYNANIDNYKFVLGRYGTIIGKSKEGYLQVSKLPAKVDTYLDRISLSRLVDKDIKIDYDKVNRMLQTNKIDYTKLGYNEKVYAKKMLAEQLGRLNRSLYIQGFKRQPTLILFTHEFKLFQ
jgi:hypothetical protein